MKHLLTILLFVFIKVAFCNGQVNFVLNFPDSLKKPSVYYCPYTINGVSSSVIGILKIGEPFDSVYSSKSYEYLFTTEYNNNILDSLRLEYRNQNGLAIIVDTLQEITIERQFNKTYKYDSLYSSPEYLTIIKNGKTKRLSLNRDRTIGLKATPVFIINNTSQSKKVYDQDFTIDITQQILSPDGQWLDIENYQTGACGMTWGWKTLPAKSVLVTSIIKYNGDYKTLARIKFDNGTVYYSNPFTIKINSKIFNDKLKTVLLDGSIMEQK